MHKPLVSYAALLVLLGSSAAAPQSPPIPPTSTPIPSSLDVTPASSPDVSPASTTISPPAPGAPTTAPSTPSTPLSSPTPITPLSEDEDSHPKGKSADKSSVIASNTVSYSSSMAAGYNFDSTPAARPSVSNSWNQGSMPTVGSSSSVRAIKPGMPTPHPKNGNLTGSTEMRGKHENPADAPGHMQGAGKQDGFSGGYKGFVGSSGGAGLGPEEKQDPYLDTGRNQPELSDTRQTGVWADTKIAPYPTKGGGVPMGVAQAHAQPTGGLRDASSPYADQRGANNLYGQQQAPAGGKKDAGIPGNGENRQDAASNPYDQQYPAGGKGAEGLGGGYQQGSTSNGYYPPYYGHGDGEQNPGAASLSNGNDQSREDGQGGTKSQDTEDPYLKGTAASASASASYSSAAVAKDGGAPAGKKTGADTTKDASTHKDSGKTTDAASFAATAPAMSSSFAPTAFSSSASRQVAKDGGTPAGKKTPTDTSKDASTVKDPSKPTDSSSFAATAADTSYSFAPTPSSVAKPAQKENSQVKPGQKNFARDAPPVREGWGNQNGGGQGLGNQHGGGQSWGNQNGGGQGWGDRGGQGGDGDRRDIPEGLLTGPNSGGRHARGREDDEDEGRDGGSRKHHHHHDGPKQTLTSQYSAWWGMNADSTATPSELHAAPGTSWTWSTPTGVTTPTSSLDSSGPTGEPSPIPSQDFSTATGETAWPTSPQDFSSTTGEPSPTSSELFEGVTDYAGQPSGSKVSWP